ncbi:MAG: DUF3999 family protein [Acidobacteriota bacterium]|nr:MAG: DUF3999 family protein [Acidobacteriota bacterium]
MNLMRLSVWVIFILLSLPAVSAGQEEFAFKRKIEGAKEGWARIVLPDEIYSRLRPDMADLRIFAVSASGTSEQVPFVIDRGGAGGVRRVDFRLINQTRGDGGRYYTFEPVETSYVNRLVLSFGVRNFDWRVSLEGSNDQRDWQTIVDNYRVLAISNELADYRFTMIEFPQTKFAYFRLFVPTDQDPGPVSASLELESPARRGLSSYSVENFSVSEDKERKRTVVDLTLTNVVPVSAVSFEIADRIDYFRPATIGYSAGGRDEERFERLGSFTLSSFDPGPYRFQEARSDRFRITIENGDSPTLRITSVSPLGYRYELKARMPGAEEYWVHYSDPNATRPDYDIENFSEQIPDELPELTLGIEMEAEGRTAKYLESTVWLWAALAVVIVLLGWFSVRLLRKTG